MPNHFTNVEFADMIYVYGFCDGNARAAVREYERRFPARRIPSRYTFARVFQFSREYGRFPGAVESIERPTRPAEENIIEIVERDPSTSTRKIARALNIPQTRVWKVLKAERLHPYHMQKVQRLEPGDPVARLMFCRWIVSHPRTLPRILFTDEAQFTRDGILNSRNSHIWDYSNPHAVVRKNSQHRFSLNVWCGVVNDELIGPHFLEERLTGETYLYFLQRVLPNLLLSQNVVMRGLHFQHDGAPSHFSLGVRSHLNNEFPNRWIGRGGPQAWPARSPDLTVLDYYVWGHMKQLVYSTEVNSREELRQRVVAACENMRSHRQTIGKATRHLLERCRKCIEVRGEHFENLI